MADTAVRSQRNYERYAQTGTTTNDYVAGLTTDIAEKWTLVIKNTHGANALKYKIHILPNRDVATDYDEYVPEQTLAAGGITALEIGEILVDNVLVYVKAASGGSQATYSISCIAKRIN